MHNTAVPHASYFDVQLEIDKWLSVKNETERNITRETIAFFLLWTFLLICSRTCISSISLSEDMVFQSSYFLSWFPWWDVGDNKAATEPVGP